MLTRGVAAPGASGGGPREGKRYERADAHRWRGCARARSGREVRRNHACLRRGAGVPGGNHARVLRSRHAVPAFRDAADVCGRPRQRPARGGAPGRADRAGLRVWVRACRAQPARAHGPGLLLRSGQRRVLRHGALRRGPGVVARAGGGARGRRLPGTGLGVGARAGALQLAAGHGRGGRGGRAGGASGLAAAGRERDGGHSHLHGLHPRLRPSAVGCGTWLAAFRGASRTASTRRLRAPCEPEPAF